MRDIDEFESVFPENTTYSQNLADQIELNKKQLGGRTFFERLLELLQIKWRRIYPPHSPDQLQELHKRIISAPISLHYKHSLFFYLLKDLSPAHHGESELATAFAGSVHLDKRFWTFIEGLWALDHLQCETAVENLTHPSIVQTFPDEIMLVLLQQVGERGEGKHERERVLPLAYYNCAKPPLVGNEVKSEWVRYLADRNVTETFYWIRERPEHEQRSLLEILISQTLEGRAWSRDDNVYTREDKALDFVGLPFTEEEEKWVEHYLTEGSGRTLKNAWDTVQMRRIATGRFREAAADNKTKGKKHGDVSWEVLRDGLGHGLGPRKEEHAQLEA